MRPSEKNALFQIAASIFILMGVFAKPLHIPSPWDVVPWVAGFVCFYLFFRADKKLKQERLGKPLPVAPLAAKRRLFWIMALALIVGSLVTIPLLPYTVENFRPFIYFYVVPAQVIVIALLLYFFWKKVFGPTDSSK